MHDFAFILDSMTHQVVSPIGYSVFQS